MALGEKADARRGMFKGARLIVVEWLRLMMLGASLP